MSVNILYAYLIAVNLISCSVCCYDKRQARISGSRISEKNLLIFCILGGSPAMYLTMKTIKHKTRKRKFMIGIPVIIFFQLIFIFLLFYCNKHI